MRRSVDLTGKVFGRLKVIGRAGVNKNGQALFLCKCGCGAEKTIASNNLRSGDTKSCGCLNRELATKRLTTHGMKHTKTHETWENMKSRCNDSKNKSFKHYGSRGIIVCKRWDKFKNFFEDMGEKPAGLTLERINTNGNYEPSNCKWATWKEQQRNRRNNWLIEYNGQTKCLAEWAEKLEKDYFALRHLLKKYPPEIVFNI